MPRICRIVLCLAPAVAFGSVVELAASPAHAGGKHHPKLYEAVQGYMLQAAPAVTGPTGPAASPQGLGSPQSVASPQLGVATASPVATYAYTYAVQPVTSFAMPMVGISQPAAAQPSLGLMQPTLGLSQPTAGLTQPTLGLSQPTLGLSQPTLGLSQPALGLTQPTLGVTQVQYLQASMVSVPVQTFQSPVLGQAPAAVATPVQLLIPYKKHCFLDCLK
jgi:hypothetical protein